jgi:peptidoglycan/LPS O-acetylase OafA/YrhL
MLSFLLRELPFSHGGTGVQLFLLISGFLIHYGTISKGLALDLKKFYARRFWRIYPPYVLVLIFFVCFRPGTDWNNLIAHLTLTYNFTDDYIFKINPSFWSLALEFQLYLIYPIYLYIYRKFGNVRSLIVIASISLALIIMGILFEIKSHSYDFSVLKFWIIWVLGAFLAHKYFHMERIINLRGFGVAVVFLIVWFFIHLPFPVLGYFYFYYFSIAYLILMDWYLNSSFELNSRLALILSKLGVVSYSFYLIHQPFIYEILELMNSGFYSFLYTIPILGLFYFCVSRVLYKFVEIPSIKYGEYLRTRKEMIS